MSAPVRPVPADSTPPKYAVGGRFNTLSKAWQQFLNSPFAQDTLYQAAGSSPVTLSSRGRPPMDLPPTLLGGTTNRGNIELYEDNVRNKGEVLIHEIGHLIDMRGIASDVTDSLRTIYSTQRPRGFTYESGTGNLPAEYVAETFRYAMDIFRSVNDPAQQDERIANLEKRFPGVTLWLKYLRQVVQSQPAVATTKGESTP